MQIPDLSTTGTLTEAQKLNSVKINKCRTPCCQTKSADEDMFWKSPLVKTVQLDENTCQV